ncbi:hypothetical protein FA95DRAFT_1125949 [Auriscalpium vulgare]|uniref:Uncharacterized protein n=1 Tax=Auriscalpium vulgare TaxID=40419 RepID=A0ACB8RVD1_9AGAM|nr:hypothetical protein FA95DRAFT_1125949 [Auriscalpium vulgare]
MIASHVTELREFGIALMGDYCAVVGHILVRQSKGREWVTKTACSAATDESRREMMYATTPSHPKSSAPSHPKSPAGDKPSVDCPPSPPALEVHHATPPAAPSPPDVSLISTSRARPPTPGPSSPPTACPSPPPAAKSSSPLSIRPSSPPAAPSRPSTRLPSPSLARPPSAGAGSSPVSEVSPERPISASPTPADAPPSVPDSTPNHGTFHLAFYQIPLATYIHSVLRHRHSLHHHDALVMSVCCTPIMFGAFIIALAAFVALFWLH